MRALGIIGLFQYFDILDFCSCLSTGRGCVLEKQFCSKKKIKNKENCQIKYSDSH
jgi:hypothetical protein